MADQTSGDRSSRDAAAVLAQLADAVSRAQRGERVAVDALGIAIVPTQDLDAMGPTDEETEEAMIELDR